MLAIDEGTTGTRAAWVTADGRVHGIEYRALTVQASDGGVVEQDANVILRQTLDACRAVVRRAAEGGVTLVALALATQRGSAVLWDTVTGVALVPAMVWQDTRFAARMASLRSWDDELLRTTGRPSGGRSPYLWAARHIVESSVVAQAHAAGRLAFGTMESWLLWHLTADRLHVTSATVACSAGGYLLGEHAYKTEWIEALGLPLDVLPELRQDVDDFGLTAVEAIGISIPLLTAIGDQHAGIVGLGCLTEGQAMCVHGTGSFVDLLTGTALPERRDSSAAALTLTAWRRHGRSRFSVETFAATTGSALDWASGLGWFESARDITRLAEAGSTANGVMFIPALAGLRVPAFEPRARAVLSGLSMETTRENVAFAMLEGIAQSVASAARAVAEVAGVAPTEIRVGGGLSSSDPLIRLQADLVGVPMRRLPEHDKASLRGAAFLAGADGLLWDSLEEAVGSMGAGEVFEPSLGAAERDEKRAAWDARIAAELDLITDARQQER